MNRYSKNLKVIGSAGQDRLSHASVLVIGCGALGGQLAMLLAGSGIGRIGIADFDTVDISNLQRQLFFTEREAGERKVSLIAARMRALNSEITVEDYNELIRNENAERLFPRYDFIIDATDNPVTKYFVDEYSQKFGRPCCIGGVAAWRGQVVILGEKHPFRYADIFPIPTANPGMLPCEIEGVMGPTASVVASLQAAEVIKWIVTDEAERKSKLIAIDLSIPSFSTVIL